MPVVAPDGTIRGQVLQPRPMDRDRLLALLGACVARGEVTLASGQKSDFYVDGRLVTLSPEGAALVGQAVLEAAAGVGATAVAGPTTGACPMVTAAGVLAHQAGRPLKTVYVRAQAKGHGLMKSIEGPALSKDDRLLLVDDVMTSGGSLLQAAERVRAEVGCPIVAVFCLVDRQAGGREKVEAAGYRFLSAFTRADLQPR